MDQYGKTDLVASAPVYIK
jgi:hypothetical protein